MLPRIFNPVKAISLLLGLLLLFVVIPMLGGRIISSLFEMISIDSVELEKIVECTAYTFYRFLVSVLIGYIVGIILSVPCLVSEKVYDALDPWYMIFRVTPTIVWIPLLLNLPSGLLGRESIPIVLGVLFSSLYTSMNVVKVVRSMPDEEKIVMKTMKVNFRWKWRNCYFPRIFVSSVTSLKIGGSVAFILVIVGESLVSVPKSLGFLLASYQSVMVMARPKFWLTTTIISFLALVIFSLCNKLNELTRTKE
jgi:ABC-type nitrate/sulfonate/bicarbonate transport system permease component